MKNQKYKTTAMIADSLNAHHKAMQRNQTISVVLSTLTILIALSVLIWAM